MNTQSLLLILLVLAVVFGLGVVVLNRRSGQSAGVKPVISEPVVTERPIAPTSVIEAPAVDAEVVETVVDIPVPPKSRWGKTALSFLLNRTSWVSWSIT